MKRDWQDENDVGLKKRNAPVLLEDSDGLAAESHMVCRVNSTSSADVCL